MGAAGGQINFEGLKDDGDAALDAPARLLKIWFKQFLGLADYDRAHIGSRGMDDAFLAGREHDRNAGVADIDEIGVLGLILLFVGSDGPGVEVVDLLVHVVGDTARSIAPSLRLQDALNDALALDGASLIVNDLDVLIEENHRGCVPGVIGSVGLVGIQAPLWNRLLIFAKPSGVAGRAEAEKETSQQKAGGVRFARERLSHDQFPWATEVRVRTSCC